MLAWRLGLKLLVYSGLRAQDLRDHGSKRTSGIAAVAFWM